MKDFGKYKIKKQIGIGGTASVYLAEHTGLDREIVLKVLSDSLFSHDIDYRKLFVEEAQIIAKLNHPNIIQVYDINSSDDRTYIEMEFLSGGTLKERVNKKLYFDPIRVIREIASALQYVLDTTGTIHRDIKPSNILFREDDKELVAVLSDFGIAKTDDTETEFTSIGVRVGTPRYMSPEQLMGGVVDHRSDLYSLGIILYELVSGEIYNRDTSPDVAENFKIPKLPNEHKKLQPIINMLTASNPNHRFKTAEELVIALRRFEGYLSKSPKKVEVNTDKSGALEEDISKFKTSKSMFNKPKYLIYALIFFVNVAGAAYFFVDRTDKDDLRTSSIENLEVMLLSFEQNETDSQNINRMVNELKHKYPNDSKLNVLDQKVQQIAQKNRKRFLLNSTNGLLENKDYDLAENQISMVMKLSPTEIETEEANLVLKLIEKRRLEESNLNKLRLEKLRLESELKIAEDEKTRFKEEKSSTLSQKVEKRIISKKTTDDCHYHLTINLDRHCHKSLKKDHIHEKPTKKITPKKNPWLHFHPKRPGCTTSVKHSHKFKNRKHTHKYQCKQKKEPSPNKSVPKTIVPKRDPFRHRHPAKPGCTNSLVHSHKYKKLQHIHKYKCNK